MEMTKDNLIQFIEKHTNKTIDKGNIAISTQQLGSGTYGTVNLAYIKNIGQIAAVKMINKKTISDKINNIYKNSAEEKENAIKNFLKNQKEQIEILKKVDHPNIVKCFNICETVNTIYIIFEYQNSGYVDLNGIPTRCDLRSVLLSKQVSPFEKVQYLLDISEGLNFLYQNSIFHRDLKPENVIIMNRRAKITDFGQSKSMNVDKDLQKQQTLFVGSPYYRAIQILQNKNYSIKCDIWSFGVLAYVLFFVALPWGECESEQMLINKARAPLQFNSSLGVPPKVITLIQNTIKINENQRWNARQVVQCCRIIYNEEKAKNYA